MPLNYGSRFNLSILLNEEIGVAEIISKEYPEWLSTLLNILEIGISIIPGVGTEVATILGLGNAAAQTGITYAETGNLDATQIGISFGAALIPGLVGGLKNIKASAFTSNIQESGFLEQLTSDTSQSITGLESRINNVLNNSSGVWGQNPNNVSSNIRSFFDSKTFFNQGDVLERASGEFAKRKELLQQINKLKTAKTISTKQFSSLLEQANKVGYGGSSMRLARNLNVLDKAKQVADFTKIGNELNDSVSEATGLFKSEIKALKALIKNGKITNYKLYRSILEKAFARTGNSLLEAAILGLKSDKIFKLLTRQETNMMKLSRLSSKSIGWSTKLGGYITSPSSLAADAISKTVAKITSRVEEFGERFTEKISKWIKRGKKSIEAAEDEFVKTGGTLMKSKWLMGYKTLQEDDMSSTILIQFKNSHPNVIVKLSISKIKTFIESKSKGTWYIDNIARNRGGRKVSELGIEGKLENLLGMLPVSKINEIIGFAGFSKSFVSQIRANSGTLIWHTGNYIQGFKTGLIQGIISEGIKSAVALGTQNQYAKSVLEGGFGAVSSGTSFGAAFSSSFSGAAQSLKDTRFEDNTKAGNIVKNVKPLQSGASSLKGLT